MLRSLLFIAILSTSFVWNSNGQTIIHSENFDGNAMPVSPSNWLSNSVSGATWRTDSTNSSTGYTAVSAVNNMLIRNTDPAGTYILTSPSFNITGFKDISVIWGSRVSVNYISSGSSLPVFEYSINGGASWLPVSYVENPGNSLWYLVNNGTAITLPASVNGVANLKFRWTVSIINSTDGSYRMDDFALRGTNVTGSNDLQSSSTELVLYPNPAHDMIVIEDKNSLNTVSSITVYSLTGRKAGEYKNIQLPYRFSCNNLSAGYYVAIIQPDDETTGKSIIPFEIK